MCFSSVSYMHVKASIQFQGHLERYIRWCEVCTYLTFKNMAIVGMNDLKVIDECNG